MRVFNNRILRIKEEVEHKGAKTYMAVKTVAGGAGDKSKGTAASQAIAKATGQNTAAGTKAKATSQSQTSPSKTVQLAPSLLFVRWTEDALKAYKQDHFTDLMIYRRPDSTDPAPIDEQEMRMFILVTSATEGRDVDLLGPDTRSYDFQPGEKVRVTEGPFKGAEGIIKRIKKDRKLLVQINGVVIVAVSNIPGQFLTKIT